MSFELPQLNYAHDALEPHIDAKTMEILRRSASDVDEQVRMVT